MITTVTGKNQVTIPAKLAQSLDIHPGTKLDWSISQDGMLVCRPLPSRGALARQVMGMGRKWLPANADPIADLLAERQQEALDEAQR